MRTAREATAAFVSATVTIATPSAMYCALAVGWARVSRLKHRGDETTRRLTPPRRARQRVSEALKAEAASGGKVRSAAHPLCVVHWLGDEQRPDAGIDGLGDEVVSVKARLLREQDSHTVGYALSIRGRCTHYVGPRGCSGRAGVGEEALGATADLDANENVVGLRGPVVG